MRRHFIMKSNTRLAVRRFAIAAVLLVSSGLEISAQQVVVKSTKSAPCGAPEYRQFDFWLGDWDAFELNAPNRIVARNHVDSILDGCVIREVYEQNDGLAGQSFT